MNLKNLKPTTFSRISTQATFWLFNNTGPCEFLRGVNDPLSNNVHCSRSIAHHFVKVLIDILWLVFVTP